MKFKSLLLGSAAALVAVSGARAADVIIPVEPDPVEYVRVCDVYGTGFYYIPGTETCLSISGYVRFRYVVGSTDLGDDDFDIVNADGDDYASFSRTRVRLDFDVREETELGTLRAFARVQAENSTGAFGDAPYGMDAGFIQLGGLTMGYLDTLWTEGDGLLTESDLALGDFQVNRLSYTYAANGFSAALSLEDDADGDFDTDVVARLAYEAGFGSLYIAGSYDSEVQIPNGLFAEGYAGVPFVLLSDDEIDFLSDDGDDAFAIKGGISVSPMQDAELKVEASYAFDPSAYNTLDPLANDASDFGFGFTLPVEWSVGAGYAQSFGKLGVGVSGIYGETFALADTQVATFVGGVPATFASFDENGEFFKLVGNVGYEITNNFDVLGEISYTSVDLGGSDLVTPFGVIEDDELERTAGFIQFVRSF